MDDAAKRFREGQYRQEFERLSESKAFEAALDYALLAYVQELPATDLDPNQHWAIHNRLIGARRVLELISCLHRSPDVPKVFRPPQIQPPK